MLILKILGCWMILGTAFGLFMGRVFKLGKPTGKYDELLEEVIRADRKCHSDNVCYHFRAIRKTDARKA